MLATLGACAGAQGCFDEPDYEGRLCGEAAPCPSGFTCVAEGTCRRNGLELADGGPEREDGAVARDAELAPDPADGGPADATPSTDATAGLDASAGLDAPSGLDAPASGDAAAADTGPADTGPVVGPDPSRCGAPVSFPETGWEARTFSLTALDAFDACLGVEDIAQDLLDRDYVLGGPGPNIVDRFGTRYTARRTFQRGVQTFTLDHDDGIRVYVDGSLIYEDWRRGIVVLDREVLSPWLDGPHELTIEHLEHDGISRIGFESRRGCGEPEAPASGWVVTYHALLPGGGVDVDECLGAEYVGTEALSLDWGTGGPAPAPSITDGWAAVGRGRRALRGFTIFDLDHDGGLSLTIGGTPVYDALAAGPGQATLNVYAPGTYDLTFELIELSGSAHAEISWQNACEVGVTINDTEWAVRYFGVIDDPAATPRWSLNGDDCLGAEVLAGPTLGEVWQVGAPPILEQGLGVTELWGAQYFAFRTFPEPTAITLGHDDGLRVWIDGALYYESWTAPQVVTGATITSPAGEHLILLDYFENLGWASLSFSY